MPLYEFVCPRGHTTEKHIRLGQRLQKYLKCKRHLSSTHFPDCAKTHECGARATRKAVYTFGVTGDLPTRGSF